MSDIGDIDLKSYCASLETVKTNISKISEISEISNKGIFKNLEQAMKIMAQVSSNITRELASAKGLIATMKNWSSYSEQFKTLCTNRVSTITGCLKNIYNIDMTTVKYSSDQYINGLRKLNQAMDLDVIALFDELKYDDFNFILYGKNGAGKSSLLMELQHDLFSQTSIVVPADRQIGYTNDILHRENEVDLKHALSITEPGKTLALLSLCIRNQELKERREHEIDDKIIGNRLIRIFDSLGLDRRLELSEKGEPSLYADDISPYSITEASDGEKTVLYFIMVTLLSPKNAFVLIDEPENHLNGSLMRKLFDALEQERGDIKFIYATHNTSFIENRKGAKLIYLEKTTKKHFWKFKKLKNYENIPFELILDIEGTNDDVIFCEGENDHSLDIKLYSLLFPNKQIISAQGCEKVTLQTKMFDDNRKVLRKKAHGIVDYDFRDKDEITHLNNLNVYTLNVNEIENAYILDFCIDEVRQHLCNDKSLDTIKDEIIKKISKLIVEIKKDYATKSFRKLHLTNKFNSVDHIEEELVRINKENENIFMTKYNQFANALDNSISNKDYNTLMKLVPGKLIIKHVASLLGIDINNYANILLNKLSVNSDLRKTLKSKLLDNQIDW